MERTKKSIKLLINHLSRRAPARVAQRIIKNSGIKTGRSIEDTLDYVDAIKPESINKIHNRLKANIEDFHLFGPKVVRILNVTEDGHDEVRNFFESLNIDDTSIESTSFPKPLGPKQLEAVKLSSPNLIRKYQSPTGTLYLFSYKSVVSLREIYTGKEVDYFGDKASSFDKIIAIKEKNIQFFNSIFVTADYKRIELRIDLAEQMGITILREVMDTFEGKLNSRFFDIYKKPIPYARINLFPIIQKIYDESEDGYIFDLSFQCPTGANRNENLSGYKKELNIKDLRKEEYHVAGTQKIGNVFIPYKVGVYWDPENTDGEVSGEPELILSGTLLMAKSNASILDCAIISNTVNEKDFNYVVTAMNDYV
ncbi:hypothetical protein [Klebsiella quasipneumoniae]|uniref:Uncharacterized protein n=7 Tax=Klebsiella pneumoniae complex TaxID=3390273 RepID=A0ABD7N5E5_9ENTR|nr:hypothetical protein [Klebsiella quasipneumoniae]MDV0652782.1 hypothetical protein [Klebsiella quasipneumoniae subsp. similipneumoniae]MDZ3228145.1 hypothetical protein [Klebsiella quasipneumoniae]MDZ3233258.1 hypothetical protein [Klebsiella quasipneumoniae]NBI25997.1 hypothetical protein [Klebsiella quasipneumoniae]OVT70354.1 hypothetical protein BME90_18625 [Klebsiella quasipneumoniae subsp. similipneumoniae]